jgi:hypothetical protein
MKSNEAASEVDRDYIHAGAEHGVYPVMDYSYNLHFLAYAAMQEANFAKARKAAEALAENIRTRGQEMSEVMTAGFSTYEMEVLARFSRWDEILAMPQPKSTAVMIIKPWHFVRGVAFAAGGKIDRAAMEQKELETGLAQIREDVPGVSVRRKRYCNWRTRYFRRGSRKPKEITKQRLQHGTKRWRCRINWRTTSHRIGITRSANRWAGCCCGRVRWIKQRRYFVKIWCEIRGTADHSMV